MNRISITSNVIFLVGTMWLNFVCITPQIWGHPQTYGVEVWAIVLSWVVFFLNMAHNELREQRDRERESIRKTTRRTN